MSGLGLAMRGTVKQGIVAEHRSAKRCAAWLGVAVLGMVRHIGEVGYGKVKRSLAR